MHLDPKIKKNVIVKKGQSKKNNVGVLENPSLKKNKKTTRTPGGGGGGGVKTLCRFSPHIFKWGGGGGGATVF